METGLVRLECSNKCTNMNGEPENKFNNYAGAQSEIIINSNRPYFLTRQLRRRQLNWPMRREDESKLN